MPQVRRGLSTRAALSASVRAVSSDASVSMSALRPPDFSFQDYAAAVLCIAIASLCQALPLRYFISQSVANTVRRLTIASRSLAFPLRRNSLPIRTMPSLFITYLYYAITVHIIAKPFLYDALLTRIETMPCLYKSQLCLHHSSPCYSFASHNHSTPFLSRSAPR